ncbi:hypothetical protein P153DRAFT_328517 [Dothidotthia symphoricarpi CBS 119687]|uniref:Uncharacterized protein n=1 Tax=Dothidotthia symphoricarpi CBS 119687 TaxID=1392245 RepID=A0A6A5ZVJ1_9PLEO|nr:uncharacterized protein P153DRAFT_328517 [Dothidotthia symphoricarpi CBS 119687]KAF2123296.1 hypothetical protein P153DRAFT_328517 [Dothidotthia symphoricarpi CBS 119687]
MDPPTPSKLAMSPGMPIFPASPERITGTRTQYGDPTPSSPSLPALRSGSPLRSHRRNDSDVSVQGLATMFETLEVKDPREARDRYKAALEKEKARWVDKLSVMEKEMAKMQKEHGLAMSRRDVRIEELRADTKKLQEANEVAVSREQFEKEFKAHRANVKKWEQTFKERENIWKQDAAKLKESESRCQSLHAKCREYKQRTKDAETKALNATMLVPSMRMHQQGLEKKIQRAESDARFESDKAAKYQKQAYDMDVELKGVEARLGDEIDTLQEKLRLVEGERDALKTSLKEEEVMRVAAEGRIALPTPNDDEDDEFDPPVRSPRKPRNVQRDDDNKENVSPKKGAVDLSFIQQELVAERRLRERAQDQIDFMKMECQFRCCSCRIADTKGTEYVHDDSFNSEMQRIKLSIPVLTPPPSNHGEDSMEGVITKQEPAESERPFTPPAEELHQTEQDADPSERAYDNTVLVHAQADDADTSIAFSPTTGTFRSVPSPKKISPPLQDFSDTTEMTTLSPTWTSDSHNAATSTARTSSRMSAPVELPESRKENKLADISVHEDTVIDSDEENMEPPHYMHEPATPAYRENRKPVKTVPIKFSPATPAFKPGRGPMTPSTVAHAAVDAATPVLKELSMNQPIDREAALEAIRQRRGRARSLAAGQGTPLKQMVDGVKDRRDISAPVSRVRRS